NELVAAVTAHVVEGADLVVHAPDDDQRGLCDRQLLGEEAALAPQLLDPSDVQPGALEDRLALELEERGRDRVLERHGLRAELRRVRGPRAFRRLLESRHDRLPALSPTRASRSTADPAAASRRRSGRTGVARTSRARGHGRARRGTRASGPA